MKHWLFAFVMGAACAAYAVQSGDTVCIDDKYYVLVATNEIAELKARVQMLEGVAADRWNKQHSTAAGRAAWHGQIKHTTITNGTTTVEYADGYKYVEEKKQGAQKRVGRAAQVITAQQMSKIRSKFEQAREAKRKARKARQSTTNEVTVTIGGK